MAQEEYQNPENNPEEKGGKSLRDEIAAKLDLQGERDQKIRGKGGGRSEKQTPSKGMPGGGAFKRSLSGGGRNVRLRDVTTFCEEAALLLDSGMPLVQSLKNLAARNTHHGMKKMLFDMAQQIESGATFTQAADRYRNVFGVQFISIFKAGEKSGTLVSAIKQVADRGETMLERRHRIISVLLYPAIVIIAAFLVIAFGFSYAMSTFAPLFDEMGVSVPWTMNLLLGAGETLQTGSFWISTLVIVVALGLMYWIGMKLQPVRLVRDRFMVRCPVIGPLIKQSLVARFSRIFATMLIAGVSVPESLKGVREAMQNELARFTISRTMETVREGGRVIPSLKKEKIFPLLAYDMMEVGEETGALGEVFSRLADIYEKKTADDMEIIGKLIQPAIIVVLALVVGFIVIAMFQVYTTLMTHAGVM